MDTYELVLTYFKDSHKPVSAKQIAEAIPLDRKDVDKVITKLKKEEKIISPKVCYWELK